MSMDSIIREHARLLILEALARQPDARLSAGILQTVLQDFGIAQSLDWLHGELAWLANMGAVTVTIVGDFRIATLTQKGEDHIARRLVLEGVRRPNLER